MAPTREHEADTPTIGGHFSAIVDEHSFLPPGRYGYESARACLYALVSTLRPERVHVPNYICDAVPEVLNQAGCVVVPYAIDQGFCASGDIDFRGSDLIILVNYYGLCEKAIWNQLKRFPKDAVIVDNSQAYFQPAFPCLANIYSPRKFLPVPDGGFIETDVQLPAEQPDEAASLHRFHYLLKRVGNEPELSRQDYLAAEKSLETPTLRKMSALTRALARAADHDLIATRRRENFRALDELSRINELHFDVGEQVPLAYPLMIENGNHIRDALNNIRIFTPKYWPKIFPSDIFEERLFNRTIFIPIDHRYNYEDMKYIEYNMALLKDIFVC